jgi:hypothetical protein
MQPTCRVAMSLLVAPVAKATPFIDARTPPAPTSTRLPVAVVRMNWPRLTGACTSIIS